MKSIHQRLSEAGIETDHHESDLYVPVTEESARIIQEWKLEMGYPVRTETFMNQVTKKLNFEIPFAYEPFWTRKQKIARGEKNENI